MVMCGDCVCVCVCLCVRVDGSSVPETEVAQIFNAYIPPQICGDVDGCQMQFYEIIRDHIFKRDQHGRYPLW